MSTTYSLTQKTPKFAPAYNPMIWVALSGQITDGISFFKQRYILWIYDSTDTTILATIKQYPDINGYGVFDIHRIIENYLSYDIDLTVPTTFAEANDSWFGYCVHMGEEYATTADGAVSTFDQSVLKSLDHDKRFAFNAIFDFINFKSYNSADWILVALAQKKFLTNQPRNTKIQFGENAFLHLMTDTSVATVAKTIKVIAYDSSGTPTSHSDNSSYFSAGDGQNFLRIPTGPAQLGTTWVPASTVYYTVQIFDATPAAVSELFTYTIDTNCNDRFPNYRLHFLNRLGGFDSFTFVMKSHKSIDIARETYRKALGTETLGVWSYSLSDQQTTQFDTQITPKLNIESDWITDAEASWLEELVTSPAVYIDDATNGLIPVVIQNTNYETRQKVNEKLINIKLSLIYSYDNQRQRQ